MTYPNCEHYDDILLFENATSARTSGTTTTNYAKNFLNKLSLMRNNIESCDFRIDINNKQLLCHKFLLIAASDYFKAMFNGLYKKKINFVIKIIFCFR